VKWGYYANYDNAVHDSSRYLVASEGNCGALSVGVNPNVQTHNIPGQ
jgi:hypothetical protein